MSKVNIGVIGVGHLGTYHSRILADSTEAHLVGVYDVDYERAQNIARQYRTEAFANVDDLIQSCDALTIAAPTSEHCRLGLKCLEQKKDVFIEKPISHTVEEADKLVAKAAAVDCILQIGHVERFNSVFVKVAPLINAVKFIEVDRLGPYTFRSTDIGVVRDLMIHDLDIILHMVDSEIKEIQAIGFPVLSSMVDIANARITFENGCVANINASRVSLKQLRKIRIFQEDRYISIDYAGQKAKVYTKNTGKIKCTEQPVFTDFIDRKIMRIKKNRPLDDELASFIECVQNRMPPVVSGEHGRKALEVATEIVCQIQKSF